MIDTLTALRNDPDNEALQEQLARETFQQPENVAPALVQAVPEVASALAEVKQTVTVIEAKVTAVAGDVESAATAAVKGVEGALEGAFSAAVPAAAPAAIPIPSLLPKVPVGSRVPWANYVGTQKAQPLKVERPKSLEALQAIMKEAAKGFLSSGMNCPVRAVGSGHSWSDSALSDGIVIETRRPLTDPPGINLDKELDISDTVKDGLLKDLTNEPWDSNATTLYSTEAGVILSDLILALEKKGLALINMGGYDGQTLAGVISTSTHGSGITLGSFSSMVESLIVVTEDGSVLQIEKTNGVTDPAKFAAKFGPTRTLKQDDDLFNASVVGVGCLGVIYAATIRVRKLYYLQEERVILTWGEVQKKLNEGILNEFRHVEVLFNPHKVTTLAHPLGANFCLLTTRNIVKEPSAETVIGSGQDVFENLLGRLEGEALALLFNAVPTASPWLIQIALDVLQHPKPVTNVYYKILNIGTANSFPAVCAEYGIDVPKQIDAMNAIFAAAAHNQKYGIYHSSPAAMRWVAPSPGYLSMQPVATCMIEMPNLRGVYGYPDIYFRYETMLVRDFGARPHWGQMNFLNGSPDLIKKLYPQVDKWQAKFDQFNQNGRFSSVFTNRVGFSSDAP